MAPIRRALVSSCHSHSMEHMVGVHPMLTAWRLSMVVLVAVPVVLRSAIESSAEFLCDPGGPARSWVYSELLRLVSILQRDFECF